MPSCGNEAADDQSRGGLCEEHLAATDGEDGVPESPTEAAGDDGQDERGKTDEGEYITDPAFDGDGKSVRAHYERVAPVYEELAHLGDDEYPGIAFVGNAGWYTHDTHLTDVEVLEDGWDARSRPLTIERDWEEILDKTDDDGKARTLYNVTSWKEPTALFSRRLRRFDPDENEPAWEGGEKPTPDYEDLRGFGFWVDLDLTDELKPQRGDLDEDVRRTVEDAQAALIERVADLYDVDDEAVYGLDSGGGAYVYGPPEATLPIADYYDDNPAARETIFSELRSRLTEWAAGGDTFDGMWNDVCAEIDGAGDVLDPDFVQNRNRQSKAPLAIHQDHDIVVTPLRDRDTETGAVTGALDYTPTTVSAVDDELCEQAKAWAAGLTAREHEDAVGSLVRTLFPEFDADGWRATLDAWLEDYRTPETPDDTDEGASSGGTSTETASGVRLTSDKREVKDAIENLRPEAVAEDTIVYKWTDRANGYDDRSGDGKRAFIPTWGKNANSGNANYIRTKPGTDEAWWVDTGDGGKGPGYGGPVVMALIDDGWNSSSHPTGEEWGRGVAHLRELGYDIPLYIPEADDAEDGRMPYWAVREAALALDIVDEDDLVEREGDDGDTYLGLPDRETYRETLETLADEGFDHGRERHLNSDEQRHETVVECEPPAADTRPFDTETRREALHTHRYDQFINTHGPVLWGDEAGVGKTTNAGIAAGERDRPHAILFDKHEKAREYQKDDVTPDGYVHLKGGAQKREPRCMDADHADEDCPDHGHTANCPAMCPVYDLPEEHDVRERYEFLVEELGPVQAHTILGDDLPEHDEDGNCAWLEQFDEVHSADRIVGVHEYQLLKTVREHRTEGPRDVIIDESPRTLGDDRTLTVEGLVRLANRLEQLANLGTTPDALAPLAEFGQTLVDFLTDNSDAETLGDLEAPEIGAETITVEVDPTDPPADVDPDDIRTDTVKESVGMPGEGYRERETHVVERDLLDEALAQAKLTYTEATIRKMKNDEWKGEPLAVDALLAAAAEAGLDDRAARRAIAAPDTLDGTCPRCGGDLAERDGARLCHGEGEGDGCGWHEDEDRLVGRHAPIARAHAYRDANTLVYRRLPDEDDLPTDPLILDATATPEKVAGLYNVPVDDVELQGDDALDANLRLTQVLDGQYHFGTLKQSPTARERVEQTVEKLANTHENPLVVGRRKALHLLDIPDDVETLHYHGARGLNYDECDAVVCIGAPHPRVDDLQRQADLLAQDHPDLRVGGDEHSTRWECANPPVYRKLRYRDEQGGGRAVATKHYTGLTGALFRETREKELEQVVHRIRPLLADETKHAYLLTNVPTDLPVDEVCAFDELADPLHALFPVDDRALDLAAAVRDAAAGDVPDGFRAETLVERVGGEQADGAVTFNVEALHRLATLEGFDVSERTVRRWTDDLVDVGLLHPGEYESRAGVPYSAEISTLTQALSVLSCNESVEVAFRRRLAALAAEADSARAWLQRAREELGLGGDRRDLPPPGSGAGSPR